MRKTIILFALLFSFAGFSQDAIFETTFEVGSFREKISNTLLTQSNVDFKNIRGITAEFNGTTSDIDAGITLSGVKAIVLFIKPTANTKVLLDNGTDKLEITGGNYSGTGLTENYVNGVNSDAYLSNEWQCVISEFSGGIDFATDLEITPTALTYITKIKCYDYIPSLLQRNDILAKFNREVQLVEHPQIQTVKMARDLSYIPNLEFSTNFLPINGMLIDESGNINGTNYNTISTSKGMNYNNAYTDIGNVGNVKTVSFRINLNSTTENIIEGASNDLEIYANAGTLTYPDFDNAYVDGIDSDVITTGWHTITVTSSTDVNYSDCKLGLINTTYGNFEIAELQMYSDEKSTTWITDKHNQFQTAEKIDLKWASVGAVPSYFRLGTGSYAISETVSSTPPLDFGNHWKSLTCTGAGTISYPSSQAYGQWEFDVYKGADGNSHKIHITQTKSDASGDGYRLIISADDEVDIKLINSGVAGAILFQTAISYIQNNTWYRIHIDRLSSEGVFPLIETLQVSDCVNGSIIPYTTFTSNGRYGFNAISDGIGNDVGGTADEISIVDTKKYLVEFDLKLNTGTAPIFGLRGDLWQATLSNVITSVSGRNSGILTATGTSTGVLFFQNSSTATDYTISGLTIKRIYPANTFATFIKGGSFEDWTLVLPSSGSNPVTSSDYTTSKYFVIDADADDKVGQKIIFKSQVE